MRMLQYSSHYYFEAQQQHLGHNPQGNTYRMAFLSEIGVDHGGVDLRMICSKIFENRCSQRFH
jgi:hypothetical protein